MWRLLLLFSALALSPGCKKGGADKTPPSGTDPEDGSNSGGADLAVLPKMQPRAKFKLPGELGTYGDSAVQLASDGKTLAVMVTYSHPERKTCIKVWSIADEPHEISEFEGGTFALSPSGKFLVTTGFSLEATVYDVTTKRLVAKLPFKYSHAFFRDDNTLVGTTRSYNFPKASTGRINVWDRGKNADGGSFEIPDNRFDSALPANGGQEIWLFMSNNKFEIECYDVAGKKLLRTIKPQNETGQPFTGATNWYSIASDGSVFAAEVSKMFVFDGVTGKIVCGPPPKTLWATHTSLLPGGTRYLGRPRQLPAVFRDYVVYDWKAKKALAVLAGHSAGPAAFPLAAGSQDGKTLVSVSWDGEGLVFDMSLVK